MRVEFWIAGVPVPQPRVKSRVLPPDQFGQVRSTVYTPETKIKPWKQLIALQARRYRPPSPLQGPVLLDLTFYLPRPQYLCRPRSPQGPVRCFKRGAGDSDNLAKAVADVLQDIEWYVDDAQVCDLHVRKFYHAIGAPPGVQVAIEPLEMHDDVQLPLTADGETGTPE